MEDQDFERNTINSGQTLHFLCPENGTFPNNTKLELCILKQVFPTDADDLVELIEQCFQKNGWPPAWRNGLYDIHHYHSTAHEALGVYSGWVQACFGGPSGIVQTATVGDVIIIPAGVSHKNMKQSADFRVVGAYPEGQPLNMRYGRPEERPQVDEEIKQVAMPQSDPVHGPDGPLMKIWIK
jgi:uncharacterized protein YjlB